MPKHRKSPPYGGEHMQIKKKEMGEENMVAPDRRVPSVIGLDVNRGKEILLHPSSQQARTLDWKGRFGKFGKILRKNLKGGCAACLGKQGSIVQKGKLQTDLIQGGKGSPQAGNIALKGERGSTALSEKAPSPEREMKASVKRKQKRTRQEKPPKRNTAEKSQTKKKSPEKEGGTYLTLHG